MIKFFRRIRYDLMEKNKTGKPALPAGRYLKYAIGEIILVVIGILIALQINNWNEERTNEASENQYYCLILDDLTMDYNKIQELLVASDKKIKISKELLLELNSGKKDKNFLLNKFLEAYRGEAFVPRNVTFNDLVSSGNIRLLKDDRIKNSLIEFYSELENKVSHLKQNSQESANQAFKLVNSSIEFGLSEFDYVNRLLGEEITQTLPDIDWSKDRNSEYYKDFQLMLVFNITMTDRNKQVMNEIIRLIEEPHNLLSNKCED